MDGIWIVLLTVLAILGAPALRDLRRGSDAPLRGVARHEHHRHR